jgi:hypothetical protein
VDLVKIINVLFHYFVNDIDEEARGNLSTRDLTIFLRRRRSIIFSLSLSLSLSLKKQY